MQNMFNVLIGLAILLSQISVWISQFDSPCNLQIPIIMEWKIMGINVLASHMRQKTKHNVKIFSTFILIRWWQFLCTYNVGRKKTVYQLQLQEERYQVKTPKEKLLKTEQIFVSTSKGETQILWNYSQNISSRNPNTTFRLIISKHIF